MEGKAAKEEAVRLKLVAEEKYKNSNLKSALKYAKRAQRLFEDLDGVSEMVTAFKILRVAAKSFSTGGSPDWYKILQVEPFSHINTIKKQYKKLALILHPDKNSFVASEEAFKLVGEASRCLSDKIRRQEYDMKLRISIQAAATAAATDGGPVETFWTACSKCRLLHQFERRYIGHNLMCPSCKKSFLAVEVEVDESGDAETARASNVWKSKGGGGLKRMDSKRKMSSVGKVLERSVDKNGGGLSERLRSKRAKIVEEMTLAEMQLEAKRKILEQKMKAKSVEEKEKEEEEEKEKEEEERREKERPRAVKNTKTSEIKTRSASKKSRNLRTESQSDRKKNKDVVTERRAASKKGRDLEIEKSQVVSKGGNARTERAALKEKGNLQIQRVSSKSRDYEIMAVEDSDFYDFDRDRVERSFKKGQVWAIYDDDDGMPRHYGLIDEVLSVNPFELKMSWLDLQNNGDERLLCWEKSGLHISCGRFKVSKNTVINSVNFFSHVVDFDRAAKEVYSIYPKKGSVWALYKEQDLDAESRCPSSGDKRCYDIVVFLTSYSEMYGLSMGYLEKVDGFKTVFKRQEIGCNAIRWLEKDNVRLFSHQIPARKLSGEESPEPLKDYWELDPASLPSELLTIAWGR